MRITQKDLKHFADIASKTASVLPFEKDTQSIKKQRIKKATGQSWQSFSYFCQIYFPHIFKLDFCDAHKDMFETVEDNNGVITITGFRGLGKTVLMGESIALKELISSYYQSYFAQIWEIETVIDNLSKYKLQVFHKLQIRGISLRIAQVQKDLKNDEYIIKGWQI